MRPAPDLAARARGAMLGALAGGGESPLLEILADELAAGRTDLRRLAERWVERHRLAPLTDDPDTAAALEFLDRHGAPPLGSGAGAGVVGRLVPVALVAHHVPRTLVSATYHIAALTHPAPEAAWGAVAVNVALARLLDGRRDFIADVIEALVGNGAPERLLAAVRRVPLGRPAGVPVPGGDAVRAVEVALGAAYHEPLAARGLDRLLAASGPSPVAAAAGALFGARDGEAAVPAARLPRELAMLWADLAERLVRLAPAPI